MGPYLASAGLTLLSFALLISAIVFFHELGHLLVGKWMGVKAIRFSIGFGPKLFSFRLGETEYRLSLLPLGGYVKFAGDNPMEELAPEDRGRGFLEQPPSRKAAIAFAGPAANFVLALFLYFAICLAPHRDLAAFVGYVKPGSPAAEGGVRYGDRVVSVDGEPVSGFLSLKEKINAHTGQPLDMVVDRSGQRVPLRITPAVHEETNPIETVRQGRIGISSRPRAAEVALTGPETPAAKAGLRDFDRVVALGGQPVSSFEELQEKLSRTAFPATVEVLRGHEVAAPGAVLWRTERASVVLPSAEGIESADLSFFAVRPGSAAARAGLRRGDKLLSVAGRPALSWDDELEQQFAAARDTPVALEVRRAGQVLKLSVVQELRKGRDEAGSTVQIPELGASPDVSIFNTEAHEIQVRWSVPEAARRAVLETAGASRVIVLGIARMITGHISSEAIGGPLMIADVARKAADAGWEAFIAVMAMISVNLGLLNLLPVPVLDGFHVLSAGLEAVRRRPLSLRFREVANLVGLALLLCLMLFAFKNDAMKMWFQ